MKTSGITAALPAQDMDRARSFYIEKFEEYDTAETRTEGGSARMPGGGEGAWFKDSKAT